MQVLVYTPDQTDLFARICGYFDQSGFSILDAKVHTAKNGYALDTFQIVTSFLPEHYRELITMQQIFKQTFLSPYTLVSFERLDGRSGERYGGVFYEMRIRAVLHYDGVRLRCRRPSCSSGPICRVPNGCRSIPAPGW